MRRINVEFYKVKKAITLPINSVTNIGVTSDHKLMIINWEKVYVSDSFIKDGYIELKYTSPTFIYDNDKIFRKL